MGQVYDIPYSALIATLLLKKRVVTFNEICDFDLVISNWGCNYCTVDDIYVSNLSYCIDDFLFLFLAKGYNSFYIRDNFDYDSKIGNYTVREMLEIVAEYPGDVLLNYVGYNKTQYRKIEYNDNKKILTKFRKNFLKFNNNNKFGVGV